MANLFVVVWKNEDGGELIPTSEEYYDISADYAKEAVAKIARKWEKAGLTPCKILQDSEENLSTLKGSELVIEGEEFLMLRGPT